MSENYVLIVDDTPGDLIMTSSCVEAQGFIPIQAKDGFEALDKLIEYDFNFKALIIDLQMPKMGGFELIKRIHRMSSFDNIPILITSARKESRDVNRALAVGVDDYLVKPIDFQIFKEKFLRIIGKAEEWAEYKLDRNSEESDGIFKYALKIISLSEVGMTVLSSRELEENESVVLSSRFLEFSDIGELTLKVSSCEKRENKYYVKLSFVGLEEKLRKKIRSICKSKWSANKNYK